MDETLVVTGEVLVPSMLELGIYYTSEGEMVGAWEVVVVLDVSASGVLEDENVVDTKVGFNERQMHYEASKKATVVVTKVVDQRVETKLDLEN